MSKADYLSKYLDGGQKKKSKSKSKSREKKPATASIVVVEDSVGIQSLRDDDNASDDNLSDEQPVKVDLGNRKSFKGFKRIDGKQIEPPAESKVSQIAPPTQTTVYRDASVRIVDIGESRDRLKQQKLEQEQNKTLRDQQLVETDLSRMQKKQDEENLKNATTFTVSKSDLQYNLALKQKDRFDDPLSTFSKPAATNSISNTSVTGNPTYNKGVSTVNRFGIKAGWFWDGIDRGNGFEELVMRQRNLLNHSKREVDDYELELEED